jgi:hypothetical protein
VKNYNMFFKWMLLLISGCINMPESLSQVSTVYVTRNAEAFSMSFIKPINQSRQSWLNPYLNENWQPGYIIFSDSIKWEGQLRLDLYRHEMEMIVEKDSLLITNPLMLNEVKMGENIFIYSYFIKNHLGQPYAGSDYFEVLTEPGPIKLLMKRTLRVDESKASSGNIQLGLKVEEKMAFAKILSYYIQFEPHSQAVPLIKGKKAVLGLFPSEKRKELIIFARNQKLNFRNLEDIVLIINHYNSKNVQP